ncbi:S8 family peptidase [Cellvibrio sp. PSBB006]|uniref:S8 family peptidase n=1 Tax=Cellvibrio sp. PSBB006 TaxID=1987723 RepID=UPI000B3B1B0F|nr:S8 family peptidase [Cellvibrio sp. PSBB006]ARU29329.1 peptidase S8 and S53, subtilisin, kexin, sedolisin [Cellvibrio sp. PSBB006]
MARKTNYLIGKAEELTKLTPPPKMDPKSRDLYTIEEVVGRLRPQLKKITEEFLHLDESLCPRGYAVAKMTLHPSFIAKGHFPKQLLRDMGVRSIGSKATEVKPDKWMRKGKPEKSPSTSLFITGKIENFADFEKKLLSFKRDSYAAQDLMKIWSFENVTPSSKLKENQSSKPGYFEVGIQFIPGGTSEFIKQSFISYAQSLDFDIKDELSLEVSNLWFIPVIGPPDKAIELARHSFVRVIRPMAPLRSFRPLVRSLPGSTKAKLPSAPPLASDVRVAILDGGLPTNHAIGPWLNEYRLSDSSSHDYLGGPDHGLGVTSAFLFGPLPHNSEAPRPYSFVDHHRILDSDINGEDPLELYRTLTHIEDILISRQYEFINISLGPDLPIDDDEIHPWTSLLDSYLADGETFLTIAAGNNGEGDESLRLHRIQVPSDSVNAVAVGASDRNDRNWQKATYSASGPGRAPGRVKPDLLAFGGSHHQYFHVLNAAPYPELVPQQGTSFSAPYLLRKAVGIRALLGHSITPLAIKALLINSAQRNDQEQCHVGWGKVIDEVDTLVRSPEGVAKILYQGELLPGKYLRVPLPLPKTGINGMVKIKATCCFSTHVDPQDTSMYTKAGVEISWKPKKGEKPDGFFQQVKKATEAELRRDAAKWEPVLHAEKRKNGNLLNEPAFEIHYMARNSGADISATSAEIIKYAFVITLEAPKHKEIFSDILEAYSEILSEIEPRITTDIEINV